MPNKDLHHDLVIKILEKAGWTILKEHRFLSVGDSSDDAMRLFIEIRAQNVLGQVVLIEVKGLLPSPVHGLMELLGQYFVYQTALELLHDLTPLYAALSLKDYERINDHILVEALLQKMPIRFMIYDEEREEIIKWMPPL
jgi:hypothetical protein